MLDLSGDVRDLAAAYNARQILPPKFSNDALHTALATVAGVDVLVIPNPLASMRFPPCAEQPPPAGQGC